MLRLTTLGGLALTRDGAPDTSPASQRRRLALLALVAAAGTRGVSRDKLLGYLWPESDEESARHSLHQSLHVIRRALAGGADSLFLGSAALQLDRQLITSDWAEFEDAVAAGEHERAAKLYAGPFLDGFFLDGAPEFERWAEGERARLAREYVTTLEALAGSAARTRDTAAVVRWRQRLAGVDPLNAHRAVGLVEALVAAGDRAGALRAAQVHATLVREDLDAEPAPAIRDWIARLRAGAIDPGAITPAPAASAPARDPSPRQGPAAHRRPGAFEERVARAIGGRYALGQMIGEGTVVITYSAHDRESTREVELHILSRQVAALADTSHFLEVFRSVAALASPHVVPLTDFGATGGVMFYATLPAPGPLLRERLAQERPLPIDEAVRVASGIVGGLAHAHAGGVHHGDLRPKHVVGAPAAMLTGIGLVEALGAQGGGGPGETGVMIGAPAYLSPEQLIGAAAPDVRSDIYSFGCVLYEMLTGELPFGSNRYDSISRKLAEPAPSVCTIRESVPEPLGRLVGKCLQRVPSDRYRSADEIATALDEVRAKV